MKSLVAEVLAAWRAAERVTSEHERGTAEHDAASAAAERLRVLYRELTGEVAMGGIADPEDVRSTLARLRV